MEDMVKEIVEEVVEEAADDVLASDWEEGLPEEMRTGVRLGVAAMLVRLGVEDPSDAIQVKA